MLIVVLLLYDMLSEQCAILFRVIDALQVNREASMLPTRTNGDLSIEARSSVCTVILMKNLHRLQFMLYACFHT